MTLDINATIDNLTLDATSSSLSIADGESLTVVGSGSGTGAINNSGTITLDSAGNPTSLVASGVVTLTGGTVTMSNFPQNTLEATSPAGSGTLTINGATVNEAGGTISADSTSHLVLYAATINGGSLSASGGTIDAQDYDNLGNVTITPGTTYFLDNNDTYLTGNLINQGTMIVGDASNYSDLVADVSSGTLTISGGGIINLNNALSALDGNSSNETLENQDNLIEGQGQIAYHLASFQNDAKATVNANVPGGTLEINDINVTNTGTIEATGGGELEISASTVTNSGGTISTDSTSKLVLTDSTVNGGNLTAASPAVIDAQYVDYLGNVTITPGTTYFLDNNDTYLTGNLINQGTMIVGDASNYSDLVADVSSGTLTISGGGTINLNNALSALDGNSSNETLENQDNLIEGQGQIAYHLASFQNDAKATVNANVPGGTLEINDINVTNTGTIEATGGGELEISASTVTNSGGTISTDSTSKLVLTDSTVNGGNLTAASPAVIDAQYVDYLGNVTITPGTTYFLDNNDTYLTGNLINQGTMIVGDASNYSDLVADVSSGTLTISGGGTINLNNALSQLYGNSNNETLENQDNTIEGQGQIAYNLASFQNDAKATVNANVPGGTLEINSVPTTNTGTIEATGGGTLNASNSPIVSGGTLSGGTWIVGSNSTMELNANISTLAATVILQGPGASFPNLPTVTSITSAGQLEIEGGLAFSTSGDLSNSGTISLEPGSLNVGGNYTQSGALDIGLGGLTAGTQFGQLNATGTATLAGTFNVSSVSSYQPLPGNMYQVVNFASKTGNFNTYNGLQIGTTLLTATFLPANNPTNLTLNGVTTTTLTSIAVTPANPSIAPGTTEQFTATGTYSDNTTEDLTSQVTWASANTSVATINSTGLASGVAMGSSSITATLGTVTGTTTLTVSPATLTSIAVTPANPSIAPGTTEQFTATGTYSDNTTEDLTSQVTWASANTSVATINSTGLASGVAMGSSSITATLGTVTGTTTLTVSPATLTSIAVTPANPSIAPGTTEQFTATGTYSDNTTEDLTSQVTWASANMSVATINSTGLASGVAMGSSSITATLGTVTGTTTLTVSPATLTSIAVTPANPSIAPGTTEQFTATGTYSDNTTEDLTSQVTWASANMSVATINSTGLASGVAMGSSSITATLGLVTGTTTLTVSPATLTSIAVTPANPSIAPGTTEQFTATGTYSDNTTEDLTSQVTWASANMSVATINSTGLASGVAMGSSSITATLGLVTGTTTLTVSPATLTSIAVTPANPSIAPGTTEQFTATGTYSDNTTEDLTSQVTWASANMSVATINSTGLASGVAMGSSSITATLGTVTGTTTLTVSPATLTSIAVTPANPSIAPGTTEQFTATGTYSDNTTEDLTSQVTWASANMSVATINSTGLASGVAMGSSSITATLGLVTGTTTLTVSPATLTSIAVTPANPSIAPGTTEQFTATGTYSDNTTEDLTSQVTWASANMSVATINSTGLASGVAMGSSSITATLGLVSGTTTSTVTPSTSATVSAVSVSWGMAGTAALQTAADGLRLLPAGRNTDLPWLGINKLAITLSAAESLSPADVSVTGLTVANYGPVTISGSGTSYTISLAQPINAADRVTVTISNANIATFTRRLDVLPGDVNDDGVVSVLDAVDVINDMAANQPNSVWADVVGDGMVDMNDYLAVRVRIGTKLPLIPTA